MEVEINSSKTKTPKNTSQKVKKNVTKQVGEQETLYVKEKVLFSWRAKARPFKKRDREFWVSVVAIATLMGFILFIVEGFISVILVISIVFLFYVLSNVEPEVVEYQITNFGIKIDGSFTPMETFTRFWFTDRFDDSLLVFETFSIPGRLEIVINKKDQKEIRKALTYYIPEEEASPMQIDKAATWLSQKIPANK